MIVAPYILPLVVPDHDLRHRFFIFCPSARRRHLVLLGRNSSTEVPISSIELSLSVPSLFRTLREVYLFPHPSLINFLCRSLTPDPQRFGGEWRREIKKYAFLFIFNPYHFFFYSPFPEPNIKLSWCGLSDFIMLQRLCLPMDILQMY